MRVGSILTNVHLGFNEMSKYAQKIIFTNSHLSWSAGGDRGVNLKPKYLLGIEWNAQICPQIMFVTHPLELLWGGVLPHCLSYELNNRSRSAKKLKFTNPNFSFKKYCCLFARNWMKYPDLLQFVCHPSPLMRWDWMGQYGVERVWG